MQKDQDEQTMNQVDGMIKVIDKGEEDQALQKSLRSAEKQQRPQSKPGQITSMFRELKN